MFWFFSSIFVTRDSHCTFTSAVHNGHSCEWIKHTRYRYMGQASCCIGGERFEWKMLWLWILKRYNAFHARIAVFFIDESVPCANVVREIEKPNARHHQIGMEIYKYKWKIQWKCVTRQRGIDGKSSKSYLHYIIVALDQAFTSRKNEWMNEMQIIGFCDIVCPGPGHTGFFSFIRTHCKYLHGSLLMLIFFWSIGTKLETTEWLCCWCDTATSQCRRIERAYNYTACGWVIAHSIRISNVSCTRSVRCATVSAHCLASWMRYRSLPAADKIEP